MVGEVVAAGGRDGVQLMVGQALAEVAAGGAEGVVEFVVRVVHLIAAEHRPQAAFVKAGIVGHERQALDERLYLFPYVREDGRVVGIAGTQPMHPLAEPAVVVGLRLNERVEALHHFPAPHDYHTHRAHARGSLIGSLEVYGSEVLHAKKALI